MITGQISKKTVSGDPVLSASRGAVLYCKVYTDIIIAKIKKNQPSSENCKITLPKDWHTLPWQCKVALALTEPGMISSNFCLFVLHITVLHQECFLYP